MMRVIPLPKSLSHGLMLVGVIALLLVVLGFTRVILSPADAPCKTWLANENGTANASITVDATVGGVTVLDALTTRCAAIIHNESGGGDMRCASGTLAPTTTVGFLIPAGQSLSLGLEAQQIVKCIRTGGTNATVSTIEGRT